MKFRYCRDPLFLVCCALYGANRWIIAPRAGWAFLRFWLNDLLLAPCALPVLFWIFRRFDLRRHDRPPGLLEMGWILALWSVFFEWAGPRVLHLGTADWVDAVMYLAGGLAAWGFWKTAPRQSAHEF